MKKGMAITIILILVILVLIVNKTASAEDSVSLAQEGFGVDCDYRTIKEIGEKSFYENRIGILPNFKNGNEIYLNDDFYVFLTNNQEMEILSAEKGDNWWSEDIYTIRRTDWTLLRIKINGRWDPISNPIKNPEWCKGTILFKIWYIPLVRSPIVRYRSTLLPEITFTRHWDTKTPSKDVKLAPNAQTKIPIIWGSLKKR